MADRPIIVVGHKNPDTDSICAAIAYARLKQLEGREARPFRAGNLNAQTKFALSRFGADTPPFLADLFPRIADIMIERKQLIVLRPEQPIGRARAVMLERQFSFLPVVDASGRCIGKLTLLGIAAAFDRLAQLSDGLPVEFSIDELIKRTGGALIDGRRAGAHFQGRLLLPLPGAGDDSAAEQGGALCVLLSGHGAKLPARRASSDDLVIAYGPDGSSAASPDADLRVPTSLTQTLSDILLSAPISSYVEKAGPTFAVHDLVRNVEREINKYNAGGFIVTDEEDIIHGVITRMSFLSRTRFPVILVDHNELSQAVDGAEQADVIEVIDHHRLGSRSTDMPITFINRVLGSTCTIIADLFRKEGFPVDRLHAGLMLSAILSDTVILKSPTTTEIDREIAEWLASVAGVDIGEYGEEMFAAGSELRGRAPREIVRQDQKAYAESGMAFSVSQIEAVGFKTFYEIRGELASALEELRAELNAEFACLMVTDITRGTTLLLYAGGHRVRDAIGYPLAGPDLFELEGVLSRKKQVLPYFLDLLKSV